MELLWEKPVNILGTFSFLFCLFSLWFLFTYVEFVYLFIYFNYLLSKKDFLFLAVFPFLAILSYPFF